MKNYFGTDGIRGSAEELFSDAFLKAVAQSIGAFIEKYPQYVVIGRDTRASGVRIFRALKKYLNKLGVEVIDKGITTTAELAFYARELRASLGVMITASHNIAEDNGLKFFTASGDKLDSVGRARFNELLSSALFSGKFKAKKFSGWQEFLVSKFNGLKFFKNKPTIFLDSASGSGAKNAQVVLHKLGFKTIEISPKPNGSNINKGFGATNMGSLSVEVRASSLANKIGFAFDGDADRLVVVDERGKVVSGDILMAVFAKFFKVDFASTVLFNLGVENYLKKRGIAVFRTDVGDSHITSEVNARGLLFGGEPSGHFFWNGVHTTGDGLLTALFLLFVLQMTGEKLSSLAKIPVYPSKSINIRAEDFIAPDLSGLNLPWQRVIVRKSGTEPVVRVYVCAREKTQVDALIKVIKRQCSRVVCISD